MSSHKLLGIAVASDTESPSQSPGECVQMQSKRSRFWRRVSQSHLPRWPKFGPRFVLVLSIAISLAVVFVLFWFSLTLILISRLKPLVPDTGLQRIATAWKDPTDSTKLLTPWPENFSRDLIPKPCHSHNDYWRRVPLFDALAAGCTGVEADVWLPTEANSTELLVGHAHRALRPDRTLSSLYVRPLIKMLEDLNATGPTLSGIFETDVNQIVTLLIDFKEDSGRLWSMVNEQLEPLRQGGWLRHWDGNSDTIVPGPVTVVATGEAPFDLIIANETYRDIFFDAPITNIASPLYNITDSYYASAALNEAIGTPSFGLFSPTQLEKMKSQVDAARGKGLLARYWATPSWPVSVRDRVWNVLVEDQVGMLNVDDLVSATR